MDQKMKDYQKQASQCYDKQEAAYKKGNYEEARKWQKEGDKAMEAFDKRKAEVEKEQREKAQGHTH